MFGEPYLTNMPTRCRHMQTRPSKAIAGNRPLTVSGSDNMSDAKAKAHESPSQNCNKACPECKQAQHRFSVAPASLMLVTWRQLLSRSQRRCMQCLGFQEPSFPQLTQGCSRCWEWPCPPKMRNLTKRHHGVYPVAHQLPRICKQR